MKRGYCMFRSIVGDQHFSWCGPLVLVWWLRKAFEIMLSCLCHCRCVGTDLQKVVIGHTDQREPQRSFFLHELFFNMKEINMHDYIPGDRVEMGVWEVCGCDQWPIIYFSDLVKELSSWEGRSSGCTFSWMPQILTLFQWDLSSISTSLSLIYLHSSIWSSCASTSSLTVVATSSTLVSMWFIMCDTLFSRAVILCPNVCMRVIMSDWRELLNDISISLRMVSMTG